MKKFSFAITVVLVLSLCIAMEDAAWAAPGDSPNNPIIIIKAEDLAAVRDAPEKHYKLGGNIDLTSYLRSGGVGFNKWGAEGWLPLLLDGGSFNGAGFKITGVWFNRTGGNTQYLPAVGLFGEVRNAEIKSLGVELSNVGITGKTFIGGLVGMLDNSIIESCYVTGNVSNIDNAIGVAGGLVGVQGNSKISNCYATGNVTTTGYMAGGLVGYQWATTIVSNDINSITNCYATGNVTARGSVGGLVGEQAAVNDAINSVKSCYATGNVSSDNSFVGAIVGRQVITNNSGSNSIATSYRYENAIVTESGTPVIMSVDPSGVYGGIKSAADFMEKANYTTNGWLFIDSKPTTGPWHWDSVGFPKLNTSAADFPFPFDPSNPPPAGGGCNAGFGIAILLLMGLIPYIKKK
jgi:hypothetical protein